MGLSSRPPHRDERGVTRIHARDLQVVDLDTGQPVENVEALLWGPGKILVEPCQEGIFTTDHLSADRSYLVIVVECDGAEPLG